MSSWPLPFLGRPPPPLPPPFPPTCPSSPIVELLPASKLMIVNNPVRKKHVQGIAQSGAGSLESRDQSESGSEGAAQCRIGLARGIMGGPTRKARTQYTVSNEESAQWAVALGLGPLLPGAVQTKGLPPLFPATSPLGFHRSRLPDV